MIDICMYVYDSFYSLIALLFPIYLAFFTLASPCAIISKVEIFIIDTPKAYIGPNAFKYFTITYCEVAIMF